MSNLSITPVYNLVLDENGWVAACPICGNPISWFDWCRNYYAYSCDTCGAFFEHYQGDPSLIYLYN